MCCNAEMILGALAVFAAGFAIFQRPINTEIMRSLLREKSSAASTLERHGKTFRNDHRSFDCVADALSLFGLNRQVCSCVHNGCFSNFAWQAFSYRGLEEKMDRNNAICNDCLVGSFENVK